MGTTHMKEKNPKPPPVEAVATIVRSQPDGHMTWIYHPKSLPGYGHSERIELYFEFEDGIQTEKHPHPGQPYRGNNTTAFLPNNKEGEKVVTLLKKAFDQRMLFNVQTDSSGQDAVVLSDIPLKTRDDTVGPSSMRYPDSNYLKTVKDILNSKGID